MSVARRKPTSVVADLFPGYFAFVMATGIVAVGAEQQDLGWLADGLYVVAAAGFVVLSMLTLLRLLRYPSRLADDLTRHATGFAFLTIVAASNVLGSAGALLHGWWTVAWALWIAGCVLWVLLVYPAVVGMIVGRPDPEPRPVINGTWFLLTVSAESVAALGALLIVHGSRADQFLELTTIATFTLGLVLYLIVMTMVFLRWTLDSVGPTDLGPTSWIAAGAMAITVLAGSNLLAAGEVSPRLEGMAPFVEGVVLLAWATATFWLPVLLAIGVWRHLVERVPLTYHPEYWSLVFPVGMYGAATYRMIAETGFDLLDPVPVAMLVLGLMAWSAAFAGLVASLVRPLGPGRRDGGRAQRPAASSSTTSP